VVKLLYNEAKEEQHMSKRPRRNHAPAFKAKVVFDSLKGEQTLVDLSQWYQVDPNQITEQKKQPHLAGRTIFYQVRLVP